MNEKLELTQLRAVAEGAIVDEPWAVWHDLDHQGFKTVGDAGTYAEVLDGGIAEEANPVAHVYTDDLADHIATFDPPTVLALLSRLEQAEHGARAAKSELQDVVNEGIRQKKRAINAERLLEKVRAEAQFLADSCEPAGENFLSILDGESNE